MSMMSYDEYWRDTAEHRPSSRTPPHPHLMSLSFPTRPTTRGERAPTPGQPTRASHCQCQPAPVMVTGQDTCLRCGRYTKDEIADTWSNRALHIALAREHGKKKRRRASS